MPSNPNLQERTNAKLRYARLHLGELKTYEHYGSLDDWERSHVESVLSHLVGAKDAFLQEVNDVYQLSLPRNHVSERNLSKQLNQRGLVSNELNTITSLENDLNSWLSLMIELRNQGTHRSNVPREIIVGVGSVNFRKVKFRDPRNNQVIDIEGLDLLDDFCNNLEKLLNQLRQSLP